MAAAISDSALVAMSLKHSSVQHRECGVTIVFSIFSKGFSSFAGLLLKHVDSRAGNFPMLERANQRFLVHRRSATWVDQDVGEGADLLALGVVDRFARPACWHESFDGH